MEYMVRTLAKSDPVLFFQTYKPPIIIDEIQKVQEFKTMKNIRETLAGRVGILELYSLSKNEVDGVVFPNELDFSLPCLLERQKKLFHSMQSNLEEK